MLLVHKDISHMPITELENDSESIWVKVFANKLNDHLFGKELFILFAASVFRKLSSIYVFSYFPFGFEGRIWDLIVSVPDHCLSFYFSFCGKLVSTAW